MKEWKQKEATERNKCEPTVVLQRQIWHELGHVGCLQYNYSYFWLTPVCLVLGFC